jgi:hypothetical protein
MTFIIIIIILKNGNQYWISKLLYLSTKKKNTVEDKKVIFPHKKIAMHWRYGKSTMTN